jgi:hypothetical protein
VNRILCNILATALEFATASSDYVKITSGSFSAVSEITFNTSNFDGATYDSFDIILRIRHDSGSNAGGATFIQFSTDNLSTFFSANISGSTNTFNSGGTTPTVMAHDNTDRNQISRDGNRNTFGTYMLTWVGLNKATEKQCFSQAIKANHDAVTRVCSETAYTHINSTASTNNAFKLIWASGSSHSYTGTYIIYGRKS